MSVMCSALATALRGVLTRLPGLGLQPLLTADTPAVRPRSTWRHNDVTPLAAYPNYKPHLTHRKHFHPPHTWGVQKQSR